MMKQSNIVGNFLAKFSAFMLVSIALVFAYTELRKYNLPLTINTGDYTLLTNIGFIVFITSLLIAFLFYLNALIGSLLNKIYLFKESYKGSRKNKSLSNLIESSILLSFGDKKNALEQLNSIDESYLDSKQSIYLELIRKISLSEEMPITMYGYMQNFPFIKKHISKKIARVEFKLGNLDKALSSAKEYFSICFDDEANNLLIAEIYSEKQEYTSMDDFISSYVNTLKASSTQMSSETACKFSELYHKAADSLLASSESNDILYYCKKSIELNPENIDAASLFAEISSSKRNFDNINNVLIEAFHLKPNFHIFMIINKFTNLDASEFYERLTENIDIISFLDLFISISVILNLEDKQKDLQDLVN